MASARKSTTTGSTKGQVILPKAVREQRHWTAGTRLIVEDTEEGVVLKPAPPFPTDQVGGGVWPSALCGQGQVA